MASSWSLPRPLPLKVFATFLSEVVEAKRADLKKNIFGLGQMSAPHECTDTNFMPQKCIFDGLISVFFQAV